MFSRLWLLRPPHSSLIAMVAMVKFFAKIGLSACWCYTDEDHKQWE